MGEVGGRLEKASEGNIREKIESLIHATAEAGSKNRWSSSEIRQWLSEYLESYQADVRRFPDLIGKPHADVLMADGDSDWLALFIVAVFTGEVVTIAAGRGESSRIRSFLEREAPMDGNRMISELAGRFYISDTKIVIGHREFLDWLS
jgi:hypothetical protein